MARVPPARDAWTIPESHDPFFATLHGEVLRQAMINVSRYIPDLELPKTGRGFLKLEADTKEQLRELSSRSLKWVPKDRIGESRHTHKVSNYDQEQTVLLMGSYRKHEVLVEVPLGRPVCNDLGDVMVPGRRLMGCAPEDIRRTVEAVTRGELCNGCGAHSKALKACSRCRKARYCNKQCQIIDWPNHKQVCKAA